MVATALESGPIEAPAKPWRNPFVIAFVLGAATITALPFVQRLALRAPAPLEMLGTWSLSNVGSEAASLAPFGAETLRGKAWLASFMGSECEAECEKDLQHFAGAAKHIADLGERVAMVTFVRPEAVEAARRQYAANEPLWHLVSGEAAAMDPVWERFADGWLKQTERLTERRIKFLARPTYAVVDQNGAVRGFWPADDEGRGHAINAVRMFALHGATP
jgi:cytochrome oxidase Cu insertion factor (SCO1/SenC/PrrC family)